MKKEILKKILVLIYLLIVILNCLLFVPFQIQHGGFGPFGTSYTTIHSNIFEVTGTMEYYRFIIYLMIPGLFLYLINFFFNKRN